CYTWEMEAFQVEALVWTTLYGAAGKPAPDGELDRALNHLAVWLREDEGSFSRALHLAYRGACG
ncbi:MAG: hypothetical protein ACRDI2_20800, partial [Chloroflexota bacterium]